MQEYTITLSLHKDSIVSLSSASPWTSVTLGRCENLEKVVLRETAVISHAGCCSDSFSIRCLPMAPVDPKIMTFWLLFDIALL